MEGRRIEFFMKDRIQLLECTLRDGCLGLEDAWINDIARIQLSNQERRSIGELITASRPEIIEIGSIQITEDDRTGFSIYQNIQEASKYIPNNLSANQMCVALFRGPDTPIKDIPYRDDSMVDGLRVIIRYSELKKSLDFCAVLAERGFKVFIQPMVTARYTEDELDMIIRYANEMDAYALYFVDSYGYMMPEDIIRYAARFDDGLKESIRIGFHAHNNMNMAFANAMTFLNYQTNRGIIIDSSCTGMGQGAGNLQTEIITDYLNKLYDKDYNYSSVLEACDFVEHYNVDGLWGYSVMRLLPAEHGVAYKYAIYLRKVHGLSYVEIEKMLKLLDSMPSEMRHRYSKENVQKLLTANRFCVEVKQ